MHDSEMNAIEMRKTASPGANRQKTRKEIWLEEQLQKDRVGQMKQDRFRTTMR